jgi:serine/alanine adding enzyme
VQPTTSHATDSRDDSAGPLAVSTLEGDGAAWDAFVRAQPASSFCHLSGWRAVIGDGLRHECIYRVAADEDGGWAGILPLVRVKSGIFGHYLLSMPFLNYGGPIGSREARRCLTEDAARLAEGTGVDLLELRTRGAEPDAPLQRTDRKVTVVMDLPDDPELLWKEGIRAKVRSQIRRPQKEGMTAAFGPEQREPFYRVFARNMRDLGTPVLPGDFFSRIAEHFAGEVEFGCVYAGDVPVAAGCGFMWRDEFEMTWASSLREYNRAAPNMLRTFNFGRCTPGSGTHRFKLQWGGRDEPLPWGQWSSRGVAETPNPDRPLFALATKVWSRLPLPVANRLGPLVAPWFP